MKIKSIKKTNEFEHTYDIEVLNQHNYILSNGCVSHNSSIIQNSTNGIEPVRSLVTTKKSKAGIFKVVVPEIAKLKNKYQLAYDMKTNEGYTNICAVIQKWIDQGISANHYYEYSPEGTSLGGAIKDIMYAYKMGLKTLYYANTDDKKTDDIEEMGKEGCSSGACAL